jgi:CheY-like chemotaxis protein
VNAATVTIVITDTGDGIDPEFMPRIFDRYAQADPSSSRKHGGLGLGLSIVRHLVELHGGQVGVSSPGKGRGATFSISLPCLDSYEAHEMAAPCQQPHDECLDGVKVLVVDDEQDSRELLGRILEDHRATVKIAGNVDAALECMNLFEADVIVSDISMPGKDGYSLMRELIARRNRGDRIPPVIAVTAFTREEDKDRVFQAGFKRHLSKPIEASELLSTVLNLSLPDLYSENRPVSL